MMGALGMNSKTKMNIASFIILLLSLEGSISFSNNIRRYLNTNINYKQIIKRSAPSILSLPRLHAIHQQSNPNSKNKNNGGYTQIGEQPLDQNICPLSKNEILQLLQERTFARKKQNFIKADEILVYLNKCNVFVNDSTKEWRGDGKSFVNFEKVRPAASTSSSSTSFTTSTTSSSDRNGEEEDYSIYKKSKNSKPITNHDEEYIIRKLQQRYDAKINRDYDLADDILDELRFLKNVQVDDRKRTFCVVDPFKLEYTFGGKRVVNIHSDLLYEIEKKVKERADAKKKKDYKLADSLLEELSDIHNVRVDDVKKEWHFMRRKASSNHNEGRGQEKNTSSDDDKQKKKQNRKGSQRRAAREALDSIPDISVVDDTITAQLQIPEGITISEDDDSDVSINSEFELSVVINEEDDDLSNNNNLNGIQNEKSILESMTIPILKEKLKEAGLPVSGRKADLIERLMSAQ